MLVSITEYTKTFPFNIIDILLSSITPSTRLHTYCMYPPESSSAPLFPTEPAPSLSLPNTQTDFPIWSPSPLSWCEFPFSAAQPSLPQSSPHSSSIHASKMASSTLQVTPASPTYSTPQQVDRPHTTTFPEYLSYSLSCLPIPSPWWTRLAWESFPASNWCSHLTPTSQDQPKLKSRSIKSTFTTN